jgi:hypothetical protein
MEEKKVVAYTAYKRTDGFEISLTIRGDEVLEVIHELSETIEAIKEKGGTPIAKSSFSKPSVPTKPCPVHPEANMKERQGRDGKPNYWSHSKGVYPNLVWCSGQGYSDETAKKVESHYDKTLDDIDF